MSRAKSVVASETEVASIAASGFFVFRTPLLALDELQAFSEGLASTSVSDDPDELARALEADVRLLRERLAAIVSRPFVRDALFVASPSLDESLERWLAHRDGDAGAKIEGALVRYLLRMTARPTPFGLFAGCATGALADHTNLVVADRAHNERHTRLDMDYVCALADALARDPDIRRALTYRPNTSLYRIAGRYRFMATKLDGKSRTYHLVAADASEHLDATLTRAQSGERFDALAHALVDDEVSFDEAAEFLDELIETQVLVPDLAPTVTGPEPVGALIAKLRSIGVNAVADTLETTRANLESLDADRDAATPARYRAIARALEVLPTPVELARLFQVDMVKAAPEARLGGAPLNEIARGVSVLHAVGASSMRDALDRFREAFVARYDQREVSLVEVLDEELGIGFERPSNPAADGSPLLRGLAFTAAAGPPRAPWSAREEFLLRKIDHARRTRATTIDLSPDELTAISRPERSPLPDAFEVMAQIAANSPEALERGDFHVMVQGALGPSGVRLLGRFCHADAALREHVERHLRAEEARRPDAVFAELVHLPEGRVGNILCRPVLREHEIPFLGRSAVTSDRQIAVTDLRVSVDGARIVLRSERLGREVLPRLTSAHNTQLGLGTYRFLAALQYQGVSMLSWDWGPALSTAPFLPRLTAGRLVLATARWRVSAGELDALRKSEGAARYRAALGLRESLMLPRTVAIADGDHVLQIDLENPLAIDALVYAVRAGGGVVLHEPFITFDTACAHGPHGRFAHELVVPFETRPSNASREIRTSAPTLRINNTRRATRSFPPGSEWLYAKIYTGSATADAILRDVIAPVVSLAREAGAADRWFFIRYADPDWHLRVRFHGESAQLLGAVLPALHARVRDALWDGRIVRIAIDTYERELERYGGERGTGLAERLFCADSDSVLASLGSLASNAGADARWQLALRGIDTLLSDFSLTTQEKLDTMRRARDSYRTEFGAGAQFDAPVGKRFRAERARLEAILSETERFDEIHAPAVAAFAWRSERTRPLASEITQCVRSGEIPLAVTDLATSYVHMHVNRFLRSAHRAHELVLYDFLCRLYESQLARARGRAHTQNA